MGSGWDPPPPSWRAAAALALVGRVLPGKDAVKTRELSEKPAAFISKTRPTCPPP